MQSIFCLVGTIYSILPNKEEELAKKEIQKYERKAARMIGRWAGVQVPLLNSQNLYKN